MPGKSSPSSQQFSHCRYHNGVELNDTGDMIQLENITESDAGFYQCAVLPPNTTRMYYSNIAKLHITGTVHLIGTARKIFLSFSLIKTPQMPMNADQSGSEFCY